MRADSVRVVGTNALRRAKRKRWFLERARAALGHPIEIISGTGGGAPDLFGRGAHQPHEPGQAPGVDIGGGSTEVVIGEGFNPLLLESLSVGCVGLSTQLISTTAASPRSASSAPAPRSGSSSSRSQEAYRKLGWLQAFGSSGTVRVIGDVVRRLEPGRAAHHAR